MGPRTENASLRPVGVKTRSKERSWVGLPGIRVFFTSLLVLIPCFWQRRIQAGDLASHIYNSWLAQQIDLGQAPDLTIVPLSTNVLFDLILSALFRTFGAEPAQRIA